jgi:hypothetical protein
MTRDEILKTLEEKGDDWVVAAMIAGSIGYHSVGDARILIEDIRNGRTADACERCIACFKGDLLSMVKYDIDGFKRVSPAKVEHLVKTVQQLEKLSTVQQVTIGLMYPTAGV